MTRPGYSDAVRKWDAETAAYRDAVTSGASEAEVIAAVQQARDTWEARRPSPAQAAAYQRTVEAVFGGLAETMARLGPALTEFLSRLEWLAPHHAVEDAARERALEARRTRNTGPAPRRLDGRRP